MWASGYYGHLLDYLWWWIVPASLILHTWCFFRLFPKKRIRLRLALGNLLVTACLLSLVGLAGETYLRFLSYETDSFGVTLTSRRWFALFPTLNSLSHRDVEWTRDKAPGVRRIAFVGDSFTYGWGIDDAEDRFTNVLQGRFNRQGGEKVEVMNVAWAAWDTADQLKAIALMINEYDVDEVVLCHLPNDIEKLIEVTDDFDPVRPPQSWLVNTESSFLINHLYYRVFARLDPSVGGYFDWLADGFADEDIWREHQDRLGSIIKLCRDHGVTLRVTLLPFLKTTGEKFQSKEIHRKLAAFFALNGVEIVDLLEVTEGRPPADLVVNAHDHHPNEQAHRLFADALWDAFYARPGG